MASIAFGIPLQFDKAYTEGISKVSQEDVQYAAELGYIIKHLGITKQTENGVELRVHPTLIPHRRLIANVDGVMNAVLVKGDAVGPTLYYGAGAGSDATASAVVTTGGTRFGIMIARAKWVAVDGKTARSILPSRR